MALKDKIIIILGNVRFDSKIKATSLFLAEKLAGQNQVYFIEYPFTLKDYWQHRHSDEIKKRAGKFDLSSDGIIDAPIPGLKYMVPPLVLPINFMPEGKLFRFILKMNQRLIINRINKLVKKLQAENKFIFINSFNFHLPDIGDYIKPALKVYHCVDPMIIPYDMKHGITSELKLVQTSDMVICTSKNLYEQKKLTNPHTYFVPNAAEIDHVAQALDEQLPIHEALINLPKPIIGYLGSVERRIDQELIIKVALANPEKSFVFAGPQYTDHFIQAFTNTANIYLTGPVAYQQIPQMLKGFDVAIIPFKKDEVSSTIFPLKLFEYMGAGKAIVATNFNPDLKDYTGSVVKFCDNADEFSTALNQALLPALPQAMKERLDVAAQNTWEKRAEQLSDLLEARLNTLSK
jgi:teichuronic acid biosynthesis glycosyltransferase TuaH